MATVRGKAVFKKKDGIIAVSDDNSTVTWTPMPGTGAPTIALNISHITNLQQTPVTNPKAILKIFAKSPASASDAPDTYMFHFNSQDTARAEADAVKDALARALNDAKAGDASIPKPANGSTAINGSTNPTAASNRADDARLFDDDYLVSDFALHTALLEANKALNAVYLDAMANRPDSIPKSVFSKQFWSSRVGLLRTFAIEKRQTRGAYNVLPTMKPKVTQDEDGVEHTLMSIDRTQALQIFNQHPVVKRAYDENVPKKLSETDFWSKFFLSRLCKQLKGERVTDSDRRTPIFDDYQAADDQLTYASRITAAHFPKTIDVQGNEENTGGVKSGNSKDIEMRPRRDRDLPIIRVLNSTSENLLSNVAPADREPDDAPGLDDATWRELTLRDLGDKAQDTRIMLNIKEQSKFFLDQTTTSSTPDKVYEKQIPSEVLKGVSSDLESLHFNTGGGVDLHSSLGIVEDSEDDDDGPKKPHVGSKSAMRVAQKQVFEGLAQSRAELYSHNSEETRPMGLPADLTEKAKLTSGTTTEFLAHFWDAFLSGDPNRAQELSYHVESLKRSATRIKAVADEAEQVRMTMASEQRARLIAHKQAATGQKFVRQEVGGGREAMLTLLGPSLSALQRAVSLYEAALAQEGMRMSTEDD